MKAWVLEDINDIRLEEIDKPKAKEGHAIVKVASAGICGSDIARVYENGAHNMPLVIGHEFSGTVIDGDDKWKGSAVGVFPLIPCKKCEMCRQQKYEMCTDYNYLGSRCDGGFAKYVSVPLDNLIRLPQGVTADQAAMLEPMAVVVHAIRRATDNMRLPSQKKIAVSGLGTIGLLMIMFLIDGGYNNILAIGNKEYQKQMLDKCNLNNVEYINSDSISDKDKVDVYFDCVGNYQSILRGVRMLRGEGVHLAVGNPASDINFDKDTYWKILRKQLKIIGTWNSSFTHDEDDDWHYVLKRLSKGAIKPQTLITHTFELEKLKQGLEIMKNKTEGYVKIMIKP